MESFEALMVDKAGGDFEIGIRNVTKSGLPAGGLLIRVSYSSMNYKDALACTPDGRILSSYPFIPGIDLAGTVEESADARFRAGDGVVVTGFGLGVSHYGGYSRYARVPAEWALPLPAGLSLQEAMIFGTAGFTAALSVQVLRDAGVAKDSGPVLVTGASGGVGSMAVAMLAKLGYETAASTGKPELAADLLRLGAARVISREDAAPADSRPLDNQRWAGAVDCVGGKTLPSVLSSLQYGGAAAVSGLTGGSDLNATVFPFILRGISLIGIDSVQAPMARRRETWERMASELKPDALQTMYTEIGLHEIPRHVQGFLAGESRGRIVVRI